MTKVIIQTNEGRIESTSSVPLPNPYNYVTVDAYEEQDGVVYIGFSNGLRVESIADQSDVLESIYDAYTNGTRVLISTM